VKAVACARYGPPEVLRLEELATPVPQKNEVRIRIVATAVTSSDCYVRGLNLSPAYRLMGRLALGWNAPRQPVLGMVLSEEVDSVGPDARSHSQRGGRQVRRSPRQSRTAFGGLKLDSRRC
jgi:NADPH:quinone reductase-like Zn-dependent oxidoreductase